MRSFQRGTSVACSGSLGAVNAAGAPEIGTIQLRDITTAIVPTARTRRGADRNFNGNSPILGLGTRLFVGRGGRSVFAEVTFSVREDGGDGSASSIGPMTFEVWRWQPSDGARLVRRIVGDPVVKTRLRSSRGYGPVGCVTIGQAEDGGLILTHNNRVGTYLRDVTYLSGTLGEDISIDNNPHSDTSICRICFDEIMVQFMDTLAGG